MRPYLLAVPFLVAGPLCAADILHLTLGESKSLEVRSPRKAAVGDPRIADLTPVGDHEVLISARSPGTTNLVFTTRAGSRESRTLQVSARRSKKPMIEVGVEVMEMESQSALKAGLSWGSLSHSSGSAAPGLTANHLTVAENDPPPLLTLGSLSREALSASVQLLVERGKAKVLAKPKLLAVSGEEASFLAGGEVPYATESKLGSSNIEWKPYGIKLRIKPTLEEDNNISSSFRAEVSGLDVQNGASTGNGIIVPALKTRWAETTVYMKSGSTLVIAGLISEEEQKLTSGLPILGDIPLIGELFRFTDNREKRTELVIFVTPSLVGQAD